MQRFESRRDGWLIVVLVATVAGLLLAGWSGLRDANGDIERWIVATASLLAAGLIVWLERATYYLVGGSELRIVSGPFRWRIPLSEIDSVRPSRALWSSPALSLDRLRIDYAGKRWVLVSPQESQAFIAALGKT